MLYGRKVNHTKASIFQIKSFDTTVLRSFEAPTKLQATSGGKIYRCPDGTFCGTLASNNAKLLDLLVNEGLEYDLLWIPEIKPKSVIGVIWVTVYGCRQIAEDLGETLQMIEVFLQDPIHAERDVKYWNPHKFRNEDNLRTSHLRVVKQSISHLPSSYELGATDFLNKFVSEDNLPETEGSTFIRTQLKRCVDLAFAKPVSTRD